MPAIVQHHATPPHLRLLLTGMVSPEELSTAAAQLLDAVRDHHVPHVITDARDLAGGHGTLDLYGLCAWLSSNPVARTIREAVLLPRAAAMTDDVRFWETACLNHGLQVKAFGEMEDAMQWLFAIPARAPGTTAEGLAS